MVKAIYLRECDLEDSIVIDGIRAVKQIKHENGLDCHIVGGMAVQSYIPEGTHRKTIDLDFDTFWGGTTDEFRGEVDPLIKYLQYLGYEVSLKKTSGFTYNIKIAGDSDQSSLLIQHSRRSRNNFEKNKNFLRREFKNQRTVSKRGVSYDVMSPEDLTTHKVQRALIFEREFGVSVPYYSTIEQLIEDATSMREEVLTSHLNPEDKERDIAKLRLYYDCIDIKSLAAYAGLNKEYMDEVLDFWKKNKKIDPDSFLKFLGKLGVNLD